MAVVRSWAGGRAGAAARASTASTASSVPSAQSGGLRLVRLEQPAPPALTAPVNDLGNVINASDEAELDRRIRALQQASGDVVVVATVPSMEPYTTSTSSRCKMFENGGRGIGKKGKDNGALIVVALKERQVRIEVGYDLEEFVTDGFAGQTIREVMTPQFKNGNYSAGLLAGATRDHQPRRRAARRRAAERAARAPAAFRRRARFAVLEGHPARLDHLVIILSSRGGAPPARPLGRRTVERLEQRRRARLAAGSAADSAAASAALVAAAAAAAADSAGLAAAGAVAAAPARGAGKDIEPRKPRVRGHRCRVRAAYVERQYNESCSTAILLLDVARAGGIRSVRLLLQQVHGVRGGDQGAMGRRCRTSCSGATT